VAGADPAADARRVAAVHAAAASAVGPVEISLDPNEGYADLGAALEMLDALAADAPDAAAALTYLEQPVPRDAEPDPAAVRRLTARVPALLDEAFTDVHALPAVREQGWSGVVVKAAKGQTPALLAHTYAQVHGLALTVQDLTAVGLALAHSARLAASLGRTWDHLEYNSRQYAPGANAALAARAPDLVAVRGGRVRPPHADVAGLYQLQEEERWLS
jgi:L-alanine-DL-glutamate epimerase-like enolase superfamily enzyme